MVMGHATYSAARIYEAINRGCADFADFYALDWSECKADFCRYVRRCYYRGAEDPLGCVAGAALEWLGDFDFCSDSDGVAGRTGAVDVLAVYWDSDDPESLAVDFAIDYSRRRRY